MEQKPVVCGNRLPPLSAHYPWLVAQNMDGTGDQTFYTPHDRLCHYRCQIPKLLGRHIRGYFHGWVILSSKEMWSVWNPVTSKILNLPPLTLGSSESVGQCCLSSPPDDPISVLLLPINRESTLVFCQLGLKRDRLKWTRTPYCRQVKEVFKCYGGFMHSPTCYDGKVYALCGDFVMQIDIIVKHGEASIKLLLWGECPYPSSENGFFPISIGLLKGSSTELFYINVAFNEDTKNTLGDVYLFKWLMGCMRWEEMVDIKDTAFFLDLAHGHSVYYNHAIAPELGGYIHIRDEMGKMMYSYDVEDKTISISSMAYPTSHLSLWECRLEGNHEDSELALDSKKEVEKDDKIVVRLVTKDEVELNESRLLNLPFHLLEMIMHHCIGVEYMRFRATCKSCHLAAPLIHWNKTSSLHKYSLVSPWLIVVDKNRGIITFKDPVFGDKYFMKRSNRHSSIRCSRFGWLLCGKDSTLVFFNPFTNDSRELQYVDASEGFDSLCFSAPPTSNDCKVVGFKARGKDANVYIYLIQTWLKIGLDFRGDTPPSFRFSTFCKGDVYALCVYSLKNLLKPQVCNYKKGKGVGARHRIRGGEYFLMEHDQQLLLVIVDESGKYVEVSKLNYINNEWEKIECLGRYTIYIDGTTCLYIETKVPELENKIFFPRLDSKNGNIVFYSLETGRYHTFNGNKMQEFAGLGIRHVYSHAWIQPTWF
ncbi:uncharacterized protein LOC143637175 [Bidens hawaiensis]|uniref:uncharacterized protein LOC143637175 n=1 Tax=Bidens hawaiensis TaxID=980011 RepID=UPI00404AEFF9